MGELYTVHEAVSEALFKQEPTGDDAVVVTSFRINEQLHREAVSICMRHGVTYSHFLRKCTEGLVNDYLHPKTSL